jgi:hypothetical protein
MFQLSEHAVKRAQQRGVSRNTIALITELADRRTRVGGGALALSLSDRGRERCIDGGLAPREVERAGRVVLIVCGGMVVTVEHQHGARRRFRR